MNRLGIVYILSQHSAPRSKTLDLNSFQNDILLRIGYVIIETFTIRIEERIQPLGESRNASAVARRLSTLLFLRLVLGCINAKFVIAKLSKF